jgi:protein-disulfide isomerase
MIAVGAGAVVAAVFIVALVLSSGGNGDGGNGGGADGPVILPSPRPTEIAQDGHLLGSAGAPVTIIEYTDFQCPYCGQLAMNVEPVIEDEFVSTGQVKVQARTVAILGEESNLAAQAAECANDQGRFWDFHDTLYANQKGENKGAFVPKNLKRFAEALGLDMAAFDSCLDSGKYASKVKDDTDAARQLGLSSTPTVFVNGQAVSWHLEDLRAAIQQALGSGQ